MIKLRSLRRIYIARVMRREYENILLLIARFVDYEDGVLRALKLCRDGKWLTEPAERKIGRTLYMYQRYIANYLLSTRSFFERRHLLGKSEEAKDLRRLNLPRDLMIQPSRGNVRFIIFFFFLHSASENSWRTTINRKSGINNDRNNGINVD